MIIKSIFATLAAYVLLCLILLFVQGKFLFHPSADRSLPVDQGLYGFDRVSFKTDDGFNIIGWFHEDPRREKAILFFYGNADSLAGYGTFFSAFASAGYSVLGVNYRGYGGSEGESSENGFYRDADAALAYLNRYVPTEKVVVVGRSIGSGVAVDLAARNHIRALALISPFTSVADVASEIFWYLPVRYLLRYKFLSYDKIKKVTAPIIFIHGDSDRLIPMQNSKDLYDAANSPKQIKILSNSDHIYIDLKNVSSIIIDFDQMYAKD